ncbi:molecular chaperone MKKS-like [Halyomorpha halys]|uniref:molecular chaperone MKKS-like n=1 Tax=Halyomorpha halys TaxID=286706 RepID=UPI0006D4CEE5|nr:McKusick-Kaufman/Bardet-Biedl syndromes putative chaperonin-like [Halyomorpha halys]
MTENLIEFKDILQEALNSLKFSSAGVLNIASLQYSLKNLLLREPALMLSTESLNKLSFEIVKGVFSKFGVDEGFNIGHVYIHVRNGCEYFSMINGVICEVDDNTGNLIKCAIPKLNIHNKMLLFAESISESDSFMLTLNEMLHNDIKLVICQKKISDSLKVILRRNNIVAVERIGLEVAKSIEQITSCAPICNLNSLEINNIQAYVGYFSTFNLQNLNGSNYIVIEKKGCSVSTLYVSCRSFSGSSYTKKICSDSIKFVYSMITTPYLLPGPIVFEEKLIHYLKNKVRDELMTEIISVFCHTLNEIKIAYKDSKCDQIESSWDCYHIKRNALIYSIDGVINCLSIGMIVRN